MSDKIAVYAGTFDPLTNGHLDILQRSAEIFDGVVLALLSNPEKEPLFTVAERLEMINGACRHLGNVRVEAFNGLLVEFARRVGARVIVRGIRAVSDYEYELQMALMNRKLDENIETVFLLPSEAYNFLSSRLVKEVAFHGGCVTNLLPAQIEKRLLERIAGWQGKSARQDELL